MLLSIVTINYNNQKGLIKTLESVFEQSFCDFEFIVIDGNSNDNSTETLKTFEKLPHKFSFRWFSEPDTGIYNAMNKGIIKAQGDYLQFLNSGDYLCDNNVLQQVFRTKHLEKILYGNRIDVIGDTILKKHTYPTDLTLSFLYHSALSHQATFFESSLFTTIGMYSENLIYASDWEFFLKALVLYQTTYKYIPIDIVFYDCNGISSNTNNFDEMKNERMNIFNTLFPLLYKDYDLFFVYQRECKRRDKFAERLGKIILKPLRKAQKLWIHTY